MVRLRRRHGVVRLRLRHVVVRLRLRHGMVRLSRRHGVVRLSRRHGVVRLSRRHGVVRLSRRHGRPSPSEFIAILCIDGGGIRGVTAAIILNYLESELKRLDIEDGGDGEHARIADYFYTIAGTSTGGLIAAMLTCPNEEGRPLFTAEKIRDFYLAESPKIFPQPRVRIWGQEAISRVQGPKYDGKHLHRLMKELLGKRRLHDTLTNVVILAFDIKSFNRVIFSSFQLRNSARLDALLSDICISTSAAPTYLPSHNFQTAGNSVKKFNLVDGGVFANNPTVVAIAETVHGVRTGKIAKSGRHREFLILSVGTGTKCQEGYNAQESAKWGLFQWLYKGGNIPLLDIFDVGSTVMNDTVLFNALDLVDARDRYLRVQDNSLVGDLCSLDLATGKNLEDLVRVGQELLDKQVSREMGLSAAYSGLTYAEALTRFAEFLHEGKRRRPARNLIIGKESLPSLHSRRDIEIEPGFRILF